MIDLAGAIVVGKGCRRVVYVHPGDAGKCVKVVTPEARSQPHRQKALARELHYLSYYARKRRDLAQVSRYHGEVATSEGPGYVFDLVRDHDGGISQTLQEDLNAGRTSAGGCGDELNQFRAYLLREGIIVADLHAGNLVRQETAAGEHRLVLIDGVGNNDFLKIADWLPFAWRRKIDRKWERLLADLKTGPGSTTS